MTARTDTALPTASVVIEWETALEGRPSRGLACVNALRPQIAELPAVETVVCFDPREAPEASVRAAFGADWPGPLVVAPAPAGLDYYGMKNHGFTLTSGEIVVFLDSDLIPEPSWLRSLLASFSSFHASCVVGRTHLDTASRYERGVALFWIFDARDPEPSLRPSRRLVSNNVAFRRSLFKHLQFPDRPTFRGQCSELASMLTARAVPIHENLAARASHPAPVGARRFLGRALHAGADHAFYDAASGGADLRRCLHNLRTDLRHVNERIARRAPAIGADRGDVAAARALGVVYYTIKALGYATSEGRRVAPRQMP